MLARLFSVCNAKKVLSLLKSFSYKLSSIIKSLVLVIKLIPMERMMMMMRIKIIMKIKVMMTFAPLRELLLSKAPQGRWRRGIMLMASLMERWKFDYKAIDKYGWKHKLTNEKYGWKHKYDGMHGRSLIQRKERSIHIFCFRQLWSTRTVARNSALIRWASYYYF